MYCLCWARVVSNVTKVAWAIFLISLWTVSASADPCGGDGQRACCALGGDPGKPVGCSPGNYETSGCNGNCRCGWGLGSSSSMCTAATPCGGAGQRGCCALGGDPGKRLGCYNDTYEVAGCQGDCRCAWGFGSSNTMCRQATPCGGLDQRACCVVGSEAGRPSCDWRQQLHEESGCSGDCRCAGSPLSSSGTCKKNPPPPPPPPPLPPPHFSNPHIVGCAPLPGTSTAGIIGGVQSPEAKVGQLVYQAEFLNGGDNAQELCSTGRFTADVNGRQMKPASCGGNYALFVVDESSCGATPVPPPPPCSAAEQGTYWFCSYQGSPPAWTVKYDTAIYGCKDHARSVVQQQCGTCRVVDGACVARCGDEVRDFGEECDQGGATPACSATCKQTTRALLALQPQSKTPVGHTNLRMPSGSGLIFAKSTVTAGLGAERDIWWNGEQFVSFVGAYSMGKGNVNNIGQIDMKRFHRHIITPRVGEVIVVRYGKNPNYGYAGLKVKSVGTKWPKGVVVDWIALTP